MGRFLPWRSFSLVIFLVLRSMFHLSSGCSVEERAALMDLRSSLMRTGSSELNSWGKDDHCCSWERVKCNNSTQRVSHLDLSSATLYDAWYLNSTVFSVFQELRYLDLSCSHLPSLEVAGLVGLSKLRYLDLTETVSWGGAFPEFIAEIVSLEVLVLEYNGIAGVLPCAALENLQNIQVLSLSDNNFSGTITTFAFQKLKNLRELYLDGNQLSGDIQTLAFENLQNLRVLSFGSNQFNGTIPTFLFSLPHIERVNLSTNFFEGPIPINPSSNLSLSLKSIRISQNNLSGKLSFFSLGKLTKLEEVDLSGNANLVIDVNIPGWTPLFQLKELLLSGCDLDKNITAESHFLSTQHHLEILDLSNNNLSGNMPNWLFTQNTTLRELYLGNNSLTGSLDPAWYTQSSLVVIYIQMNRLVGQLPTNISSISPSLLFLDVSSNYFSGSIPTSLCKIFQMQIVDLSNNKLSGEVPACLFSLSDELCILKVSNNKLGGQIFGGVNSIIMDELYLDGNKFEGEIPQNLSGSIEVMDLHDNELSGRLNASLWDLSSLKVLNLAGNHITGDIHPHICGITDIRLLDLSRNNLTGSVPNCSFTLLNFLNLSVNSLSGDFSYPLFNTTSLLALDMRDNQFKGNLHWLSYLDSVRLLFLGRNKLEGQITSNLCSLVYLRIVDLSHNKLSGSLPACIGNISFEGEADDHIFQLLMGIVSGLYQTSYDLTGFTFATKGNLYTYGHSFLISMAGIDLSANMLDGEIPWELGNMSHIKSLNLSNNFLVGPIPPTFGGLKEIESLDLSHNELSGRIPLQLTQLSSLGVFSVAYNLSGCIPYSGQLGLFGTESYLGNTNLHKITQGSMCTPSPDPVAEEDVGETHGDPVLYMITAAGFVLAFWATVGFSFCHPYGRSVMLRL